LRVGDDGERHVTLLCEEIRGWRLEHDYFADAGGRKLLVPLGKRPQVQAAEPTSGVPAELEVDETGWIRKPDLLGAGGHQLPSGDDGTDTQVAHLSCPSFPAALKWSGWSRCGGRTG
jgi:hypothetical protein